MKKRYILFYFVFLTLLSKVLVAQNPAQDTIVPAKGDIEGQLKAIRKRMIAWNTDSAGVEPRKLPGLDTTKYSRYGDLLNDDPEYNRKSKIWRPAAQVVVENTILNIVDRSLLKLQFADVDIHSWNRNLHAGF